VTAANAGLGSNFTPTNEPDTLWNYELGTKWTLLDGAINVNAALYFLDWADAQVTISPVAQFIIVPVGDVEGTGFDLEVVWNTPIEGLTIAASGNINETELKNVDPTIQASAAPRLQYMKNGNQLVGTVKRTFATVLNYQRPIGIQDWMMNYNLRYSYRDKQQSSFDGRVTPTIGLASTRLSLGTERYEVEIFSDNLLDEKDPISVPGGQNVVPYPRTYGIGFQARF
jgi:iron complex outermembrane receptor protein